MFAVMMAQLQVSGSFSIAAIASILSVIPKQEIAEMKQNTASSDVSAIRKSTRAEQVASWNAEERPS